MSALRQIVPPAEQPLELDVVKSHLRVEHDADDPLIETLIKVVCRQAEIRIRRQLVTATWEMRLNNFPAWQIRLERPPLRAVHRIEYLDQAGELQTLDPSLYLVDAASEPGTVEPAYQQSWPLARCQTGAVTIQYSAGYGAPGDVPETIGQWMLLAIGDLYKRRERSDEAAVKALHFADSLIDGESWGGYP